MFCFLVCPNWGFCCSEELKWENDPQIWSVIVTRSPILTSLLSSNIISNSFPLYMKESNFGTALYIRRSHVCIRQRKAIFQTVSCPDRNSAWNHISLWKGADKHSHLFKSLCWHPPPPTHTHQKKGTVRLFQWRPNNQCNVVTVSWTDPTQQTRHLGQLAHNVPPCKINLQSELWINRAPLLRTAQDEATLRHFN